MSISTGNTKRILDNDLSSLEIDLFGGAITDFHLKQDKINPMSFKFSSSDMTANNKKGAPYQGHFLCLGRWGEPSPGEIKAGIPNHGQFANMLWDMKGETKENEFMMQTISAMEGLRVERSIEIENKSAAYIVNESVTNINPLGRLFNMVQHPTLASPFLDNSTVINCNAQIGFNNVFSTNPAQHSSTWPYGICEDMSTVDLSRPVKAYNSIFSFVIKKNDKNGWISAYSPKFHLILGYVWNRKNYPWINLWQDWSDDQIRYWGIEFGTSGIHKPFDQILADNNSIVFEENTFRFIDAGESICCSYISFLHHVNDDLEGIDDIRIENENIVIKAKGGNQKMDVHEIDIRSILKKFNEDG